MAVDYLKVLEIRTFFNQVSPRLTILSTVFVLDLMTVMVLEV